MGTKLETLQEKLAKLQADITAETAKETEEQAIAGIRDAFAATITDAISAAETETGKSLREIGLGVWVAYPAGENSALMVSALVVGDDGLPKMLRRPTVSNGNGTNGNGNGTNGNGNGAKEYVLADGRAFDTCLAAVHAMGIKTHDDAGKALQGKKYHHRHDRLPTELADAITVRIKATTEPATTEPATTEEPAAVATG